jgi:hypothetical protein
MGTKIPALLGPDKGGRDGSGVYAMPPKSEVNAREKKQRIATITNLTGSQPSLLF